MPLKSSGKGGPDAHARHNALVDTLKRDGTIKSAPVEAAFRALPRHLFLPGLPLDQAYSNQAIAIKHLHGQLVSSASQPAAMAIMLEQLALARGQRVLEIGAGTGHNAALLAHIVGPEGQVITLDIDEEIVAEARQHLAAANVAGVQVLCADGGAGYPPAAPYDRIILTVGAWEVAESWYTQLRPNGRLLLPLWIRGGLQKAIAFRRSGEHIVSPTGAPLTSVSMSSCSFLRLRGAFAGPEGIVWLDPGVRIALAVDDYAAVNVAALEEAFAQPNETLSTGVRLTHTELFSGLHLWLAVHAPRSCTMTDILDVRQAKGKLAQALRGIFPIGLLDDDSLSLLIYPPARRKSPPPRKPFELFVRQLGPNLQPAEQLASHVRAWEAAGRPGQKGLRVRVYSGRDYRPAPGEAVVPKRHTQLVFDWPRT